jgi:hypothetical protein
MPYTSDRRLFTTADRSRVVEEDDPEAAFLLVGEGGELDDATAERYGLNKPAKAKGSQSNKSRTAPDNKRQAATTTESTEDTEADDTAKSGTGAGSEGEQEKDA